MTRPAGPAARPSSTLALVVRAVVRVGLLVALCVWGIRAGWAQLAWLLGAFGGLMTANLLLILRYNPSLLRARLEPDRPNERFDRLFIAASLVLFSAVFGLAGWDVLSLRIATLPVGWAWLGLALWALGDVPIA